jgi:hypothetical protein
MLQHVSQMFLTEIMLKAANAILVDYHHRPSLRAIAAFRRATHREAVSI